MKFKVKKEFADNGSHIYQPGDTVELSKSVAEDLEKRGYGTVEKENKKASSRKTKEEKSTKKTK